MDLMRAVAILIGNAEKFSIILNIKTGKIDVVQESVVMELDEN